MHTPSQRDPLAHHWHHLEEAVERLHQAARQATTTREFYTQLLAETSQILDAEDLAAWTPAEQGSWRLVAELGVAPRIPADVRQQVVATLQPLTTTLGDHSALVYPIADVALEPDAKQAVAAVICVGSVDDAAGGARQLLGTLAEVAADFHALDRLRIYERGQHLAGQAAAILRRLCLAADAEQATRVLANDGRLAVGCDRLSVLIGRGRKWELKATSGVDRVERQTDFRRDVEALAAHTAVWGEPVELGDGRATDATEDFPPSLMQAAALHLDHSHPRRLCCVPFRLPDEQGNSRKAHELVLLGESFADDRAWPMRTPMVELGETCIPGIAAKLRYDRWFARWGLRWSDRMASFTPLAGWGRLTLMASVLAIVIAGLIMISVPHEIEAPATLQPVDRQHVFATTTGTVAEVRVRHGEAVEAGDVLAILNDPELALERQTVAGQLATVRERLAAIRATRTERSARQRSVETRLPLSAEAQQLAEQETSLVAQRALLEQRGESLVLRSPQRGQVLTLDVQTLLEARPVERGQQLFTIANVDGPWELAARLPQRDVSAVLAAQEAFGACPVRYRLAGEPGRDYRGVVQQVAAAAVLDAEHLSQKPTPVEATIRTVGSPSSAARPGMSATVRIDCGKRSLGYVWFHDAWGTIYRWFTF